MTLEASLDAERALAKRLRGEFADVLAEIATTKAALMKSNFEIEDVLREIEPHRRHSIGEPSPGAPETIEETDAEAPESRAARRLATRRAARGVRRRLRARKGAHRGLFEVTSRVRESSPG